MEKSKKVVEWVGGSILRGVETENSDADIYCVVIPPIDYYFGLNKKLEHLQSEIKLTNKDEIKYLEIKKYFNLLLKNDFSSVESLFVPKELYIGSDKYEIIIANRHLFLDKDKLYNMAIVMSNSHIAYFISTNMTGRTHDKFKPLRYKKAYIALSVLFEIADLLSTGTLTLPIPDVGFLRNVRAGRHSDREIMDMFEVGRKRLENAYKDSVIDKQSIGGASDLSVALLIDIFF